MGETLLGNVTGPIGIEKNPAVDDSVCGLVEQWPHRPYHYLPEVSSQSLTNYVVEMLRKPQEGGAITYIARRELVPAALLQFEPLDWDSKILGVPVGRISWLIDRPNAEGHYDIRCELLRQVIAEVERLGTHYLLIRVPAIDVTTIHALEGCGFELLDGLLTFGMLLAGRNGGSEDVDGLRCRPFVPDDLAVLQEIAAGSFSIDRFHADPVIGKTKADELHRQWVKNSCAGFADGVLVAEDQVPVGFTTLKIDRSSEVHFGVRVGVVVLVATSKLHRRRGVARLLTRSALEWFAQADCQWVEVGTQLANIQASRVYQAAGFKLVNSSLTFRKLL